MFCTSVFVLCLLVYVANGLPMKVFNWPWMNQNYLTLRSHQHECGVEVSSNLIHHNPWLVHLEYHVDGVETRIRCAGTLIGRKHIITAAHCITSAKFSSLVARLGEYDTETERDCVEDVCAGPVKRINVAHSIVHPHYRRGENDIAVLILETEAPYTDFIRPICLPSGSIDPDTTFFAAGWGELINQQKMSRTKKIIPLPFWSRDRCEKACDSGKLPKKIICAGGESGIDTCRGDSGGPLTMVKEVVELWGVTSSGDVQCGKPGSPAFYTSIPDHLEWIQEVQARGSMS